MDKQTVGDFVTSKLIELKREVSKTHNAGGFVSVYSRVARLLKAEFPDMTDVQKAQVLSNFQHDAELTMKRTGQNVTGGLGSAARILGIKSAASQQMKSAGA